MAALNMRQAPFSGQMLQSLVAGESVPPVPSNQPLSVRQGIRPNLGPVLGDVLDAAVPSDAQPPMSSPMASPGRLPTESTDYAALLREALGQEPKMSGWQKAAAFIGPALMAASGNVAGANQANAAIADRRRGFEDRSREAAVQAVKWRHDDDAARAKANQPQYFSGNEDRVRFDPTTGSATRVYDAPQDFEDYAATGGLEPGTPEYFSAVQDYVLRGNGPSAFKYDQQLETLRQAGRLSLEGTRHANRSDIRGAPTYRDLHPKPAAPARAGKAGSARPTATGPNGQKVEWDGKAWVPAQ